MEQLTLDLDIVGGRMVKGMWVPEGMKRCSGYREIIESHLSPATKEYFYESSFFKDGFQNICIECHTERNRLRCVDPRLKATKDSLSRSSARYNKLLESCIADAWCKDKEAIADRDEHHCYLCDTHIFRGEGGFDHVVPLGISKDDRSNNVRYVHDSCNKRKADMTLQECVQLGKFNAGVFERVKLERN